MNCGLSGEFRDFVPTLVQLREDGVPTVVTNYWYESAESRPANWHTQQQVQSKRGVWFPEGNQNEVVIGHTA